MPDISFDSLIILLLVLASLFGRLFQKKKTDEGVPPPQRKPGNHPEEDENEESTPQLQDVLRDFWEKNRDLGEQEYQQHQHSLEPIPEEEVIPPPPPREIQEDPTPEQSHPTPQEVSNQVAYHQKGETDHQTAATKSQRAFDITSRKTNALAQSIVEDLRKPDSLRKALVLREILGPPVSLRNGQTDGGI